MPKGTNGSRGVVLNLNLLFDRVLALWPQGYVNLGVECKRHRDSVPEIGFGLYLDSSLSHKAGGEWVVESGSPLPVLLGYLEAEDERRSSAHVQVEVTVEEPPSTSLDETDTRR